MKFFSTRNEKNIVSFKEAVLKGISEEGGLFVPEEFPRLDLDKMLGLNYEQLAAVVLGEFISDFSEEDLRATISSAYSKFPEIPAPLTKTSKFYFLELYHGPTFAFKDFALSILPIFMKEAKKEHLPEEKILILTATSGDTGSAALEGFSGVEGIDINVFFPAEGVSSLQRLQMVTNPYPNTFVAGIKGNFDDAQNAVKQIFTNEEFLEEMKAKKVRLSSANSINIGRLLPQIVYYFSAYMQLLETGEIHRGERVTFSVPTGNFGDILALYYAYKMGLPVRKMIVASNENKVLTDFFKTGIYDRNRDLKLTNSPSMDIVVSSNLERLLYDKTKDADFVASLQEDLKNTGRFELDADFSEFYAGYCDQKETLETIRQLYEEDGYLIDTHTAVACKVAEDYSKTASEKIVVVSTASPFKFGNSIIEALGLDKGKDTFENLKIIENYTGVKAPESLLNLESKEVSHQSVIEIDEIEKLIGDSYEG